MATIHTGYDEDSLRHVRYHSPSANVLRTIGQDMLNRFSQYSESFRTHVDQITTRVKSTYNYAMSLAASRRMRNRDSVDSIKLLLRTGDLQNAGPRMQTVLLASPLAKQYLRSGRCEGYATFDTPYIDRNRNAIAHTDRTYRLLYNGVARRDNGRVLAHNYYVTREDRELYSRAETLDARMSIRALEHALWAGDVDPTSTHNALL